MTINQDENVIDINSMRKRRLNINWLYQSGKRIYPSKIIFDYKYMKSGLGGLNQAFVCLYGTSYDNGYKTLCYKFPLRFTNSADLVSGVEYLTQIIELPQNLDPSGMWVEIYNYEYISLHRISIQTKQAELPIGSSASQDDTIKLLDLTINDGTIFTSYNIVTLNNLTSKTATHYRASIKLDFSDTIWVTYSPNPSFEFINTGLNRVYMQVKDATDESNVLYKDIVVGETNTIILSDNIEAIDFSMNDIIVFSEIDPNDIDIDESIYADYGEIEEEINIEVE